MIGWGGRDTHTFIWGKEMYGGEGRKRVLRIAAMLPSSSQWSIPSR